MKDEILSLKMALSSLALVVLVVGLVIYGALYANKARQSQVVDTYTKETTEHIAKVLQETKVLFGDVFDECELALTAQQQLRSSQPNYSYTDSIDCPRGTEQLARMRVGDLVDASAMAYLRMKGSHFELLQASGTYSAGTFAKDSYSYNPFSYDPEIKRDLLRYLTNEDSILMWQDFLSYIPGKEVLVAVSGHDQYKTYIFRGVIEK